jgi:lipooligosaccharide transport system ATP-binding protein
VAAEGDPAGLVATSVGRYTLEVESPDEILPTYLAEQGLRFDRSGRRLIVYGDDRQAMLALRDRFCSDCGYFRAATLEDVFLRLTGRELRE